MIADDFNNGLPIPPVAVADMKQMWAGMRRMSADTPPRPDMAISLRVYASYGIDAASRGIEEFMPVSLRHALLDALLKRGVLNDYMQADEPGEKLFLAAATLPCSKEDVAEVFIEARLSELSPDETAKAREEMRAQGYDEKRIEKRFLAWLRDNC